MKVWVTKYALTTGIEEYEAEPCNDRMIKIRGEWSYVYFHFGHWHTDRSAAVAKAEDMRRRRIAALHKQLARLDAMKFEEMQK